MAYVTQQIIKTTESWASFDAQGKPVPKNYWLFERVTEGEVKYYKFKISDGVHLFSELPYQLLNGNSARISSDGYWETFNDTTQRYDKTTVKALGVDGKSAFELWQSQEGNADKTLSDFFNYLKGAKGDPFTYDDFTPEQLANLTGKSAYQVWLSQPGHEGKTVDEYLAAIKGAPFIYSDFTPEQLANLTGKSAYQVWLSQPGNEGKTVDEYLASLKGQNGVISVDAPSNGKTYGRKNEGWAEVVMPEGSNAVIIPNTFLKLVIENLGNPDSIPTEAALEAFGGEAKYQEVLTAIENKEPIYFELGILYMGNISILSQGNLSADKNNPVLESGFYVFVDLSILSSFGEDFANKILGISFSKGIDGTLESGITVGVPPESKEYLDLASYINSDGTFKTTISQEAFNDLGYCYDNNVTVGRGWLNGTETVIPITISQETDSNNIVTRYNVYFDINSPYGNAANLSQFTTFWVDADLSVSGYTNNQVILLNDTGTKFLSNSGEYLYAIAPTNLTVATTLTNLPIDNYSIKVTLSGASALSFASTPPEGWECMIDVKNTSSSDITQPLPNASGWQCEDTSLTIAAGKIASISVRYVHSTYVVIAKGN